MHRSMKLKQRHPKVSYIECLIWFTWNIWFVICAENTPNKRNAESPVSILNEATYLDEESFITSKINPFKKLNSTDYSTLSLESK